jgi:hypothetical protein
MARAMPSQVVQTIDALFPHAERNAPNVQLAGSLAQLHGILNLLEDVPDELILLTSTDYSELILPKSAIEEYLAHSRARGASAVGYVSR